ncbi:MAG: helix-turn-helix domain-containing protein [Betaproteobacteria bacterium]
MTHMADDPELRVPDRGPGTALAAARTAQNLSVPDVARQLKLSASQVAALEAGEYERLPGPVFVRGFVRNYARLLKLDPDRLLDMMATAPGAETRNEMPTSRGVPFPTASVRRWPRTLMLTALLVLCALAAYEFYWSDRAFAPAAPASTAGTAVTIPVTPALHEPPGAVPGPAPTQETTTAALPPPAPAGSEAAPASSAPAVTAADEAELRFTFKRDSWVEVRERGGRTVFTGTNPAGTEQRLTGRPPLTLVIGNAGGVLLIYNEQAIDLKPHIVRDGVARLTLK